MQRRFQQAFSTYILLICVSLVSINSAAYLQGRFMKKENVTLQSYDTEYKMASVSTCGLQCLSATDNRCLSYEFYSNSTTNICRISHLPTVSVDIDVSDSVVYEVGMEDVTTTASSTQFVPPVTNTAATTTSPTTTSPITTTTPSQEISELEIYTQQSTTGTYLYQEHLPAMSEFTACFWFDLDVPNELSNNFLFTISTSAFAQEALFGFGPQGNLALKVQDSPTAVLSNYDSELPSMMEDWHKHCFTWKSSGDFAWYRSSDMGASLELMDSVQAGPATIRNDGYFILLQFQTTHGGGLSSDMLTLGKVANFNMWDKEMSLQQINFLTCTAKGNVTSWDTLQRQGDVDMGTLETPFCSSD